MAKMDFCALFIDSHGKWHALPFVVQREVSRPRNFSFFWSDALNYAMRIIEDRRQDNPENVYQLVRLQGSEYTLPDQEGGDQK